MLFDKVADLLLQPTVDIICENGEEQIRRSIVRDIKQPALNPRVAVLQTQIENGPFRCEVLPNRLALRKKFETAYNRIYSRYYRADGKPEAERSGKDMTREEFMAWSRAASKAKADYQQGLIPGEKLLCIVENDISTVIK